MRKSFARIYSKGYSPLSPFVDFNTPREMLGMDSVDFEGKSIPCSKYVIDDPSSRYDGLTPEDFALENQLKVGVPMKPVSCQLQRSSIERDIERANSITFKPQDDEV